MENRSHALVAGLFTLLLLIAGTLAAIWLTHDNSDQVPYDLVTVDSVQGLMPQADVRYRGLLVGKVQSIGFDLAGTGDMLIRIGVREGTPMTDSLKATVEMKGVTGVAYIDLDDDGKPGQRLTSTAENVARLRMQPGLAERLMNRAAELMNNLQRTGDNLNALLGAGNQQVFERTLVNIAEATGQVNVLLAKLDPLLSETAPLVRSFNATAHHAGDAAREISELAAQVKQALAGMTGPDGLVAEATHSIAQIRQVTARLNSVMPEFTQAADSVGQAAHSATRTMQGIQRAPQSVLFGPAPPRPGPGEPGFAGFGQP